MPVQLAAARSAKGQLARYLTVAATHYEVPSIGGTESVRLPRFALILTPTRIPQPQPKESEPHIPHPDLNPSPSPSPSPIQVRLPSDAVKRDTLTSLAARGDCTAASCEAVGVANKLAPPTEVPAIQAPAPVPVPEVAAAPTAAAPAASLAADDPAAELAALQAQLAALKAAAGQQ